MPYDQTVALALDLGNGVKMDAVLIPAGSFMMGSPDGEEGRDSNEGPQRLVTFAAPFYMGKYQVTQAQWHAVMGRNPSWFQGGDLPVVCVSWDDCREFCRKLSELSGRKVRLPTEAEWEYACRAGTTTPFHYGDNLDSLLANFDGEHPCGGAAGGVFRERTTPVGSFEPNAWGLYDMHGNVWEWCEDKYGKSYIGEGSDIRVIRGGSWEESGWNCRSAARGFGHIACNVDVSIGLRVVVSAGPFMV